MHNTSDWVTIEEASRLLGVHRNTVRNRVKAGRYKAHKVVTPQGETVMIERESLGLVPHSDAVGAQQAQAEALVQSLLAPFIAELGTVKEELGRERERREQAERERDELKARLERKEPQQQRSSIPRIRELEREVSRLESERNELETQLKALRSPECDDQAPDEPQVMARGYRIPEPVKWQRWQFWRRS
jgi:excisionase family DNA binding protein